MASLPESLVKSSQPSSSAATEDLPIRLVNPNLEGNDANEPTLSRPPSQLPTAASDSAETANSKSHEQVRELTEAEGNHVGNPEVPEEDDLRRQLSSSSSLLLTLDAEDALRNGEGSLSPTEGEAEDQDKDRKKDKDKDKEKKKKKKDKDKSTRVKSVKERSSKKRLLAAFDTPTVTTEPDSSANSLAIALSPVSADSPGDADSVPSLTPVTPPPVASPVHSVRMRVESDRPPLVPSSVKVWKERTEEFHLPPAIRGTTPQPREKSPTEEEPNLAGKSSPPGSSGTSPKPKKFTIRKSTSLNFTDILKSASPATPIAEEEEGGGEMGGSGTEGGGTKKVEAGEKSPSLSRKLKATSSFESMPSLSNAKFQTEDLVSPLSQQAKEPARDWKRFISFRKKPKETKDKDLESGSSSGVIRRSPTPQTPTPSSFLQTSSKGLTPETSPISRSHARHQSWSHSEGMNELAAFSSTSSTLISPSQPQFQSAARPSTSSASSRDDRRSPSPVSLITFDSLPE